MPGRTHFEEHAAVYEQARPPYPDALWETLRDLGALNPGDVAVDLGAGTGQATGPLLEAGLRVTAVEPGPKLAAQIRAAYPAATVVEQPAETVTLPDRSVDLVTAATSIHWMDLDILLPRVHDWLRSAGFFLVWRNVFGDPSVNTPFRERIARIVAERHAPPRSELNEEVETTTAALTRTGYFSREAVHTFRWSIEFDRDQVHRLFTTFSDWTAAEVDSAAAAVDELGGRVVEHYMSWLIVLRPEQRSAAPPPS